MKTLPSIWREVSQDSLALTGRSTAEDMLALAWVKYPTELSAEQDRATRQGYLRQIKLVMRQDEEQDGVDTGESAQMGLPGFTLPAAFAIPLENGDFEYVRPEKMTWADLLKVEHVRDDNLTRAQKRLIDLKLKMDVLRPYMINAPARTLAEAALLYRQSQSVFGQEMVAK